MNLNTLWETRLKGVAWQIKSEFLELLRLMREYEVKSVLEVGCHKGGTALGFIGAGATQVISIDPVVLPEAEELTKEYPQFSILRGTSFDFHDVLHGRKFDMLYIDGDHTYQWAKDDYNNLVQYVKQPGGMVVFHDIVHDKVQPPGVCEVDRFWNEIRGDDYLEIMAGDIWGGIGVKYL
jgi:predicted O-methyltransferase YrrM